MSKSLSAWPRDPNCPSVPPDDRNWCRIHERWETADEFRECDRQLYEAGYRNVGGVILTPAQLKELGVSPQ